MKSSEDLQKLLPFGYLFLVVMGILKESIFFYQIGINILKYSTLMDILISPIATLTTHPLIFLFVIIVVLILYYYPIFLSKHTNKRWAQKLGHLKNKDEMSPEEISSHFTKLSILSLSLGLLSFFVGIGIGGGGALTRKIENNKLKYNYELFYNSGESEQVYLIDSNSLYYFYIAKGNKAVQIAPVASIKKIELTTNRMLK